MGKYFNPRRKKESKQDRYNNKRTNICPNICLWKKKVKMLQHSRASIAVSERVRESELNSFGKYKQFLSTPLVKTC